MAIAIGDILQLTLEGVFNGSVGTRNIFHYRVKELDLGGDTPFESLNHAARDVWAKWQSELRSALSATMVFRQMKAVILSGADVGTQNLYLIPSGEQAGLVAGNALPPYDCYGFRYQGSGGTQRNGYKRFSGVTESVQNVGVYDGDPALLNAIATKLFEDVQVSGGVGGIVGQYDLEPVIVKKAANGLDPSDIVVISSWKPVGVAYYGITTQNTRKYGRGI